MENIKLPKLKKIDLNRPKKKKILLLSDDLRANSGIGTMSRELVVNTAYYYDWVQLGAALNHPDHGKIFDISNEVNQEIGVDHAYVKIYAHTGYGNQNVLREIISIERPDVILFFTDPRFWQWLFFMEDEVRRVFNIPLVYLSIWDNFPVNYWDSANYASCDGLLSISKQTNFMHQMALDWIGKDYINIDKEVK